MKQSARGFTLLEVLIAIAIFALLGLGSYRMLHSVLNTDEATRRHELQLREVVRALYVLEQDLARPAARGRCAIAMPTCVRRCSARPNPRPLEFLAWVGATRWAARVRPLGGALAIRRQHGGAPVLDRARPGRGQRAAPATGADRGAQPATALPR